MAKNCPGAVHAEMEFKISLVLVFLQIQLQLPVARVSYKRRIDTQ